MTYHATYAHLMDNWNGAEGLTLRLTRSRKHSFKEKFTYKYNLKRTMKP
jgi:hypothetical protein